MDLTEEKYITPYITVLEIDMEGVKDGNTAATTSMIGEELLMHSLMETTHMSHSIRHRI